MMRKRGWLSIICGILCSASIQATIDTLQIYQTQVYDAGDSGLQCVWDYSTLSDSISHDVLVCESSDSSHIDILKFRTHYEYQLAGDTLFTLGFENSTSMIRYDTPIAYLRYPLSVGDSLRSRYTGSGEYAHLLPMAIHGELFSTVDGHGRLVLPEQQLDDVFRVTSHNQLTESMSDTTHFFITTHKWYAQWAGKYPLLETMDVMTIRDNDTLSSQLAFYRIVENMPSCEIHDADSCIMEIDSVPDNFPMQDIRLFPNPVVDNLHVAYRLVRSAKVKFALYTRHGMLVYQSAFYQQEEGERGMIIPVSTLPADDYVLYIIADELFVSTIIIKQY